MTTPPDDTTAPEPTPEQIENAEAIKSLADAAGIPPREMRDILEDPRTWPADTTAPVTADGPVLCLCGNPDNCSCPPAPVTAEDLRERAEAAVEDWFNHLADDDEPTVEQIGQGVAAAVLAVRAGELGRLRNRITALEANGSELLARAERAEATVDRVEKRCRDIEMGASAMRVDVPHWVISVRSALHAPESTATAPSPVTAATEAHGETTEAQEGAR